MSRVDARALIIGPIALFFGVLVLAQVTACGANQRQKTLHASFIAVTSACDGLEAWDTDRQKQIVAACTEPACTREEGHKRLDEHQAKLDKAYAGCGLAIRKIAEAYDAKGEVTLKRAADEAAKLFDEIQKLKGGS